MLLESFQSQGLPLTASTVHLSAQRAVRNDSKSTGVVEICKIKSTDKNQPFNINNRISYGGASDLSCRELCHPLVGSRRPLTISSKWDCNGSAFAELLTIYSSGMSLMKLPLVRASKREGDRYPIKLL